MYSTLLLTLQLCTVLFISVSCTRLNKLSKQTIFPTWTSSTGFVFSFINILDSKFVGLFMFIVANILTGLINLSMNTLHASNTHASIILLAYMVVVTLSSYYFYFYSAFLFLPSQKLEWPLDADFNVDKKFHLLPSNSRKHNLNFWYFFVLL